MRTKLDTQQERAAGDDSGALSRKPRTAHESARPPEAPPTPSFAAFIADAHYFGDLCIALAGPLVMLSTIVRSVDPWVGASHGGAGAAVGTLADPWVAGAHGAATLAAAGPSGSMCQAPLPQAALDDFPVGSSVIMQALHVARRLPWYAIVAPSRLGDWATVLLNILRLNFTCTLLLLAACPRSGSLWTWWRRHRALVVFATNLMTRCLPLVSTLLLLPPRAWPTHQLSRFIVSASSSPLVFTLALCAFDLMAKVPLTAIVVQALAQTAAVFIQAYRVAPTIVTRWREQQQQPGAGQQDDGPVPLQCGSPLRPEHSALLSCRPLALQVLLGLAMVAWPVGLSWAVERRLRRQHAAMCREWERRRGRQQGQTPDTPRAPANAKQHGLPACHEAVHLGSGDGNGHQDVYTGSVSGSTCKAPAGSPRQQAPAHAQAVGPRPGTARGFDAPRRRACDATGGSLLHGTPADASAVGSHRGTPPAAAGAPRRSARFRSDTTTVTVSVKVQEHPGDYKEYGSRLASMLQDCVRQELRSIAASSAALDGHPAAVESRLCTTVIRGCVQVVLWGWVPEGELLGGIGAGGVGDAAWQEDLLQRLAPRLKQWTAPQQEAGSVRGVSVQVGQQVAVLGHPGEGAQLPGGGAGAGAGGRSTSVRLLLMSPAAVSLAAFAEPVPLRIRLFLHSPVPQMARVLLLSERQGLVGSSAAEPHGGPGGGGLASRLPTRARLLLELPVQLVGDVQELQLELGEGQLAGLGAAEAVEGQGVAADDAGAAVVLRVMMVGPEHQAATGGGERDGAAGAPRLVHWVAPPLLLLPPAAAAEVCGAWEAMQQEAGGGPAGEKQQSGGGEHALRGSSSGHTNGTAGSPVLSGELPASAERQCSLWWSHMAPLLGDLAHALVGQGVGQEAVEEARDPVWQDPVAQTLIPYLQGCGMGATLSALGVRGPQLTRQQGHGLGAGNDRGTTAAAAADSPPPDLIPLGQPSAGPVLGPMPPTSGSGLGQATHQQQQHSPARTAAYSAGPSTHTSAGLSFPFPLLPRPFSPPALELRYQQWRLGRLAHMLPYALFFDAGLGLSVLLAALGPLPVLLPATASRGAAPVPLRLAQTVVFGLLGTVADVLGLAVVYTVVVLRPRRVLRRQQEQQQEQQLERQRERARKEGAQVTQLTGTLPAVRIGPRDLVCYRLAACVAGPAAMLLCAVLTIMGLARLGPRDTGSTRAVYGSGLIRAVVMPCLQQMSTWEAVAAAPLLGLAEALILLQVQVTWCVWWVGVIVLLWRLVAVVVSAVWERRIRRQFVQGQPQQQAAAGAVVGASQRSGAGEGPGGSKERIYSDGRR